MNRFFITGLPRSRTAWLAAVFTNPEVGAHCLHEPDFDMRDFRNLPRQWLRQIPIGTEFAGISAPGLHRHREQLMRWFPDAPWLIVNRRVDEVGDSLRALGINNHLPGPEEDRELFKTFRDAKHALMLDYYTLDDVGVMEAAWHTLCRGAVFDAGRQRAMSGQRIVNAKSEQAARDLVRRI